MRFPWKILVQLIPDESLFCNYCILMPQERDTLEAKYNQLILGILEMGYQQAQDRLKEISRILGNPEISVEEATQLLRYSKHLADYCKSYLVPDTTPPQVITLDKSGEPIGLRDLDLARD